MTNRAFLILILLLGSLPAMPLETAAASTEKLFGVSKKQVDAEPVKTASARLAGKTVVFYTPGHGTQIEYYAASGRSYLWYPGNKSVVPGRWRVDQDTGKNQICFLYSSNTRNPLTGKAYGEWGSCKKMSSLLGLASEAVSGDPFKLSSSSGVPFVMSKARTSISKLKKQIKKY